MEVVLFSNTYTPAVWALNPLHAHNNVNGLEEIEWPDYLSRRHPGLFARQVAHVRKIVKETNGYDNVIYEICNEPGGRAEGRDDRPSTAEVNEWLAALIEVVRETEAGLPNRHLIAGQEAFCFDPWEQSSDLSFQALDYDIVNMHPLPNTTYGGTAYDLGDFMSKQLRLRALRDYCLATYAEPSRSTWTRTTSPASTRTSTAGRSTASGPGPRCSAAPTTTTSISRSSTTARPARRQSQRAIRTWMGNLARFMQSLDLVQARPLPGLLRSQPPHTVEAVLWRAPVATSASILQTNASCRPPGVCRRASPRTPEAGQPIAGVIELDLAPRYVFRRHL